ncbi:MAG: thioredoxin domain-containing protein [Patescibacteria group bacterium]
MSQEVSEEQYVDYSQNELNNSNEEFLILFFHAAWCPSCKAFEEKILSEEIPENIKFLKVDYDSQAELRKKYNVVSQTTFVLVNSDGELRKRWIGSRDLQDILTQFEDIPESIKTYSDEELRAKLTPLQYKVTQ